MLRILAQGEVAIRFGGELAGVGELVPLAVDARGGREQERDQGRVEVLADHQHGGRRQQGDILARDVPAQVHQARRHGDRGQESESAMIGLVLIEVQQAHAAIVEEGLDVIGLEGGDEERRIQLPLLQGLGRGGDVLLDQRRPANSPSEEPDSTRPLAASNCMAMALVPLPGGPTPMRLPAS